MKTELYADQNKKKEITESLRKQRYQIGVYYFFINAFALFRWLVPVLAVVITLASKFIGGSGIQSYEWVALAIKCVVAFICFSFAKWLLQLIVNKLAGGMCLENSNERVELDSAGTLSYFFEYKKHKMVETIALREAEIGINEETKALSIQGRVVCYEMNKDGSLSLPKEKRSEVLIDYYTPSLFEALQRYNGGNRL